MENASLKNKISKIVIDEETKYLYEKQAILASGSLFKGILDKESTVSLF
jgi:hypothetical protein